ncbi:ABC transporter substrate-binding protein [Desulfogranum japonicum]|uniref:ABC transporter substrate-binding protein n=1 Tax=Desulfogranum japonicum TaxID=231447 RepID=UPI00041B5142|nr:ABC transporter substrate-binding protein [Desulfogranum japonicum]
MKPWIPILIAIAIFLACTTAPAAASKDKTVNMAIFWLDGDIDPTSAWHGWTLTRCGIGENLLQIDENLQYKPVIAERWEQPDALTTIFTIREGITFQNGAKVDAEACKASLERALKITDRKDVQFPLDSITSQGNTLTIKTTRPYATLLNVLADPVFIIVDAEAAAQDPDGFQFKPVTTGPFKVDSFSPEAGMVLSQNTAYWKGEPDVETVNVKYISDANTRSMALQSGELDVATQLSAADLPILEKDNKLDVLSGPNLRVFLLRTNFTHPWMQIPEFRQAVHSAIHKNVYAEKIAGGIPARGPFNALLPFGYSGDDAYPYNRDKAIQLLDRAGITDSDGNGIREFRGTDIVLQYICMNNHGAAAKNIGIAMQSELKKVGIGMEVKQMENFAEAAKQGKYDFLFERWTSAPTLDPQYFLESGFKTGSRGNYGQYSNPDFDNLLGELDRTLDRDKRYNLGTKGAQILMDDVAAIFLFYQKGNVVYNKRISGIHRFVSEIYYIDDRLKFANE